MTIPSLRTIATQCCVLTLAFIGNQQLLPAQDLGSIKFSVASPPPRPKNGKDVMTVLKESGKYSTFLKLVDQAGLTPVLRGTERDSASAEVRFRRSSTDVSFPVSAIKELPPGVDPEAVRSQVLNNLAQQMPRAALLADQITVFAPTDSAFKKLSKATRDSLQLHPKALLKLLRGHVANTGIEQASLSAVEEVQTMNGTTLSVKPGTASSPKIAEATVVQSVYGDNGVIYGIDTVIRR